MRKGLLVTTALLLLAAAPAAAQELRGRIRENFQRTTAEDPNTGEDVSTDFVTQSYTLSFKNTVAPGLFWQARLRAVLNGFDQDDGRSDSTDTQFLEPFLQIVYRGSAWESSGGARISRTSPKGDLSTVAEQERRDYFGRVSWFAEDRPRVGWAVSRIELSQDDVDVSTEDRSLLTVSQGWPVGGASFGLENRWFTNLENEFTRNSIRATGNGNYRKAFADGRLVLSSNLLLAEGLIKERTPQAIEVDEKVDARRGLFGIDATPGTGTLGNSPSLIDGDLDSPAVDLSDDYRNIGVDLGFDRTVSKAFIYLERSLQQGNERDYSWSVYASDDGDLWTLLSQAGLPLYDSLRNRFEIPFAETRTRYLKVVNTDFSRNEPPLAVTEIEATAREPRANREESNQSSQSGNVGITYRASPFLDFTLFTFSSRQAVDREDDEQVDEDLNSTFTATLRPGRTAHTLRAQAVNRRSTGTRPIQDRIASYGFSATPLDTLDFALVGTHRKTFSLGDLTVVEKSVNFRAGARILAETDAALDLSFSDLEDREFSRDRTRERGALTFNSTLRPGLLFTNLWEAERIETVSAEVTDERTDYNLRSRISYRPTGVFGGAFEYYYQKQGDLQGGSRLIDVDWLPFPGGALQLEFRWQEDRRSITGALRDEARVGARWTLNPKTLLDLSWTALRVGEDNPARTEILAAFLEYRF